MEAIAHEAVVALSGHATAAAPGGAITVALCGHWTHDGPCRWPHNTSVLARDEDSVTVRVDFTCPADDEDDVRRLIRRALHDGAVVGPNGTEIWTLLDDRQL